jgi:hypothetical protein
MRSTRVRHFATRVEHDRTFEEGPAVRKLTVADIVDMRAWERERADFRSHIIELKKTRRVAIGSLMSIVFENTDTMRWQIQEMARAERMLRDEQIEHEVVTYNELIPEPGQLSGTLMLELTDDALLREWLPKLVGIENHVRFVFPDGSSSRGKASDEDEARLTREETTAAVHFLRFELTPSQIEAFADGPVHLGSDHPEYSHDTELDAAQRAALTVDLRDAT